MKIFFFTIFLNAVIFFSFSQEVEKIAEEIESQTQTYIFSEGKGKTIKEADKIALEGIITQISISVESHFKMETNETNENFKKNVESIIKTYSSATLQGAERLILSDEPDAVVFRYIARKQVKEIFEKRAEKIQEFVGLADKYVREHKISDALKYYYWGLLLLKSHPEHNSLKSQNQQLFSTYISTRIHDVFSQITIAVIGKNNKSNKQNMEIQFKHQNESVQNIDFSYWTGRDWTTPITTNNDRGTLEFGATNAIEQTKIKIEYTFENEVRIDKEMENVMQSVNRPYFKQATKRVTFDQVADRSMERSLEVESQQIPKEKLQTYNSRLKSILQAITEKDFTAITQYCTSNGKEVVKKLLQYGNVYVMNTANLRLTQKGNTTKVHSVPMRFSFKSNNKQFVEDVVFHFDENKKLKDLTFALSKKTHQKIIGYSKWPDSDKFALIDFLEHYKTAYALERLDYISSIFSEDALIIVGHVIKKTNIEGRFKDSKTVKYTQYSKSQYVKTLDRLFKSKEYVNLKFENIEIKRSSAYKEEYGIQVKQNYYSSNYGDQGYLFLLVNFEDPQNPKIYIRTWQPEKDEKGKIYGLSDF